MVASAWWRGEGKLVDMGRTRGGTDRRRKALSDRIRSRACLRFSPALRPQAMTAGPGGITRSSSVRIFHEDVVL